MLTLASYLGKTSLLPLISLIVLSVPTANTTDFESGLLATHEKLTFLSLNSKTGLPSFS
jgi:hypothetical protein